MMKKILTWTLLVCVLFLCACGSDEKETTEAVTEELYPSLRYEDLPSDGYTEQQALEDQCLVLSFVEGDLKPSVSGMENWTYFLEAVENDADEARIRAVYFQNGIYYYTDLTYINGYFSLYTLNEFQNYENAIGSHPYIKRIEGIEPNTGNQVCYYVLTELADLTSEDVLSAARICDIESERGVPYEPIPFTQYLYLE